MKRESVDGLEGDDERTENERSPPPRSRPTTRDLTRKVEAERRRSRSRGNTPASDRNIKREKVKEEGAREEIASSRPRRQSRSRSSSRVRDRDPNQSKQDNHHDEKEISHASHGLERLRDDHLSKKSNGNHNYDQEKVTQDNDNDDSHNENGLKKRKRVRLRHRNRNSRKRNNRQDRRYKPYTELSWEERKQRDDQESERAAMRRANRPTPYNTTQFLMEDHKVDTPDLSNSHMQCDTSDEIEDEMNGDYLERDFSAVYEEVQSERLEAMSKEQLVSEVLALQRRVTELEEEQKVLRPSSAGESDQSSSGQPVVDKGLRKRLESLSSLEGEVQRLKSENSRLRKTSHKELVT